jgi:hypothetical protein
MHLNGLCIHCITPALIDATISSLRLHAHAQAIPCIIAWRLDSRSPGMPTHVRHHQTLRNSLNISDVHIGDKRRVDDRKSVDDKK